MLSSCAGSAALPGVAMCLAFRGDNAGPPEPAEVLQNWALLRTHFPNATAIKAAQLDEYFGLEITHKASFRKYLVERFFDKITPPARAVNLLDPADLAGYEAQLRAAPIDLACIGIGENGHIAFNDPGAPFEEEAWVNKRELDVPCRMQQVGEGWFASLDECPTHAASLSIPAIMACASISCVVPDERKREALGKSIRDDVDTACPATILRTHADCALWLDQASSPFA